MRTQNKEPTHSLRIHGDNIIECERALLLITNAFSATLHQIVSSPYLPRFEIERGGEVLFHVELLPGYGRWNINIKEILQQQGAPLREAVDALVTRVTADRKQEQILLGFEFCSALPAGNNAWQRNGRALVCTTVGIPYLYYAEVGGVELDKNRVIKAPRFPNPIIPFSYLTAGKAFNVICLPVFSPSPSSSEAIRNQFADVFGWEEGKVLVKALLENAVLDDPRMELTSKALKIVQILSSQRKSIDTSRGEQWTKYLELETASEKEDLLKANRMDWSKKSADKVTVSKTFRKLSDIFQTAGAVSVGAKDIPLCLISRQERKNLAKSLSHHYVGSITPEFIKWVGASNSPLVVVWITGFKPGGDDSRPDRGLVPLARMLFGDDTDILSIVYGPAKPAMWRVLRSSPQQLARQNGLWEAVINLSDAVLTDSAKDPQGPYFLILQRTHRRSQGKISFALASPTGIFSEHDVDSTLHLLFTRQETHVVFEGMCNPPGGDWSGLSVLNFQSLEEYRWTSLPRVSAEGGKRPDHVIQFWLDSGKCVLLAIESKNRFSNLEDGVGIRMTTYVRELVQMDPTIAKSKGGDWKLWQKEKTLPRDFEFLSGGAYCWTGERDLKNSVARAKVDIAIGVEFKEMEEHTLLHIKAGRRAEILLPRIYDVVGQVGGRIEIQIH